MRHWHYIWNGRIWKKGCVVCYSKYTGTCFSSCDIMGELVKKIIPFTIIAATSSVISYLIAKNKYDKHIVESGSLHVLKKRNGVNELYLNISDKKQLEDAMKNGYAIFSVSTIYEDEKEINDA